MTTPDESLWIELAPISGKPPTRLILVLHDAGSNADQMMPIGVAWQLKFPSAKILILDAPTVLTGRARIWYPANTPRQTQAQDCAAALAHVNLVLTDTCTQDNIDINNTVLVGFGQGADLILEHARRSQTRAGIVVSYAGKLLTPIQASEQLSSHFHLLCGELNSLVPLDYARQAKRQLETAGASVTLDIIEDLGHDIDQELINLSTWRVMRTIFQGREKRLR